MHCSDWLPARFPPKQRSGGRPQFTWEKTARATLDYLSKSSS